MPEFMMQIQAYQKLYSMYRSEIWWQTFVQCCHAVY